MGETKSRRVAVSVAFDGVDITASMKRYLLSMTYTDSEEDESDSLDFVVQDREGVWMRDWLDKAVEATAAQRMTMSAVITPENWPGNGGPLPTGTFEMDSVRASGPPSVITIQGSSLSYGSSIRQTKKTKAWEKISLSGIAKEIAGNAGYGCMYEAAYDPTYKRKEQNKKSDIAFLSQLCHDAGLSLKCTDGKIVLFDQSVYEAMPPVMTITHGGGAYESYDLSAGAAGTQYGSCRVSYTDIATGRCIEGIATADGADAESQQRLEITARVESAGEAQELAEKNLRLHNKFNRTASFTMPGNTALVAGVTVQLEGFGGWDGKYMVKKATHKISGAYTVTVELRKVL